MNGQEYGETDYVFPMKNGSTYVKAEQTVSVNNASGTMTFTPKGKQVVWTIDLYGTKTSTLIADIDADEPGTRSYYNLNGMNIGKPQKGLVIEKRGNITRKRIF